MTINVITIIVLAPRKMHMNMTVVKLIVKESSLVIVKGSSLVVFKEASLVIAMGK
jgi:hypothetical protein